MNLIRPEAAIPLKRHQKCAFTANQAGCHNGDEFEKTVEIGETAQSKPERHQQLLVGALFANQAVEKLTQ